MSLSAKRRRLFIAIAVLLGLLTALALSEAGLRVYVAARGWTPNCYVTNLALLAPDPEAGYTLRKSVRVKSSGVDIEINALGLRGPEISRAKPEGTIRIAVLGGSSVFGYLVGEGEDSCRVLEDLLQTQGIDAEVLNAGVNGYNLRQVRHRYDDVVAVLQPDFVILYLGWNDTPQLIADSSKADGVPTSAAPPWHERMLSHSTLYGLLRYRLFPADTPVFAAPESAKSQITPIGAANFRREYAGLVQTIEASGAVPVISTQVMATGEHCQGLRSYLGSTPQQIAANEAIGRWIVNTERELAAEMNVSLIDCEREIPCDEQTLGDPIHLTRLGHEQVAELWMQGLMPLLITTNTQATWHRLPACDPIQHRLEAYATVEPRR